ncbi:hypothetical protein KGM_210625 [Danaus plexippus plexippus]|uniref:Uncharacterized protein n=1 Tax=Danaus plexippus plexippus TaxID=278856 RepID=A0A212FI88_DANPL|nr:hypothetical protein KGM_210625 [Danaus plexippus plexippus]
MAAESRIALMKERFYRTLASLRILSNTKNTAFIEDERYKELIEEYVPVVCPGPLPDHRNGVAGWVTESEYHYLWLFGVFSLRFVLCYLILSTWCAVTQWPVEGDYFAALRINCFLYYRSLIDLACLLDLVSIVVWIR